MTAGYITALFSGLGGVTWFGAWAEVTSSHMNYYHSHDPFETENGYSDTTPVGFYNGRKYGEFSTMDARSFMASTINYL